MVPLKFLTEESEYYNAEDHLAAETTDDDMTAFRFNNGTLEELPLWAEGSFLCQANPLGVDW